MSIATNIETVKERIRSACLRVNRPPDAVQLVAISKKMSVEQVLAAIAAGVHQFGENRVEEALLKIPAVNAQSPTQLQWHFVGHVQSRKAKDIVRLQPMMVHSLDSLKLAQRYQRIAAEANKRLPVLLEMNVSGEEAKTGWQADDWQNSRTQRQNLWQAVEDLLTLSHLDIVGFMTMAPFYDDPEATRPHFRALAELRATLANEFRTSQWQHLSMGMTNDFEVAIEEGATIVRIGRAIFGERPQI